MITVLAAELELLAGSDDAGVELAATDDGTTEEAAIDEGAIELGATDDAGAEDAIRLELLAVVDPPPPPPQAVSPRVIKEKHKTR